MLQYQLTSGISHGALNNCQYPYNFVTMRLSRTCRADVATRNRKNEGGEGLLIDLAGIDATRLSPGKNFTGCFDRRGNTQAVG